MVKKQKEILTTDEAAYALQKLATKYGERTNDYKNESEGTSSDRHNYGHDIAKFTVHAGKLELIAEKGSSWSSCGTYDVVGGESRFSTVKYFKNDRQLFYAYKNEGGQRYHDALLTNQRDTTKTEHSDWDVTASGEVKKHLTELIAEISSKLKKGNEKKTLKRLPNKT